MDRLAQKPTDLVRVLALTRKPAPGRHHSPASMQSAHAWRTSAVRKACNQIVTEIRKKRSPDDRPVTVREFWYWRCINSPYP